MSQFQKARRNVLKLVLAASGLLALEGVRRFLTFEEQQPGPVRVTLDNPEVYSVGSTTTVPGINCWLMRDRTGFYALSRTCSHLGCQVIIDGAVFTCPCHGSQFATDGRVIHGPATQALHQVSVGQATDGRLVVDAGTTVPSGTRFQL